VVPRAERRVDLAAIDVMFTILPERCSRIWGKTSWISRAAPNRLTSNWFRASDRGTSSTAP
jgi:hypothetical protein